MRSLRSAVVPPVPPFSIRFRHNSGTSGHGGTPAAFTVWSPTEASQQRVALPASFGGRLVPETGCKRTEGNVTYQELLHRTVHYELREGQRPSTQWSGRTSPAANSRRANSAGTSPLVWTRLDTLVCHHPPRPGRLTGAHRSLLTLAALTHPRTRGRGVLTRWCTNQRFFARTR